MPRRSSSSDQPRRRAPAMTPEDREDQLIALAIDLAEKKLLDGTASNQVITHYLRLGSTKERLEKEKLEKENALLKAKTESLQSQKEVEAMYRAALVAMSDYKGTLTDKSYEEDEDE